MKKFWQKFILLPAAGAVVLFLIFQMTFVAYYYWSCVRLKKIEIVRLDTIACKTTIPVKFSPDNITGPREQIPVFTPDGQKYNLVRFPEKNALRLTEHRHILHGFACWNAMYQITDAKIETQFLEILRNFSKIPKVIQ